MIRLIRRIAFEVRGELEDRRDMRALAEGRLDTHRNIAAMILAGQVGAGKTPEPLWRVIWRARRERPFGSTLSKANLHEMSRLARGERRGGAIPPT